MSDKKVVDALEKLEAALKRLSEALSNFGCKCWMIAK